MFYCTLKPCFALLQLRIRGLQMPFIVPLLGSPATLSGIDAGNEAWSFGLFGKVLTAANLVAQEGLWSDLVDAAMALELGVKKSTQYGNLVNFAYAQPTNGAAREIALILQTKDITTQQRWGYRLPAIDPTLPLYVDNADAKDVIRLDAPTEVTDFITAFNAFAVSPVTGNALNIYGMRVGRGNK